MKDSEISREKEKQSTQVISIDLVYAARRHIVFLKAVAESSFLYNNASLCQAIRRYDELWMPLIADVSVGGKQNTPILLPPLDVQWVWHCHTLNPEKYRRYCQLRFSKILEKPVIYDDEIEEYALNRCSDVWCKRYPFEPFELEECCCDDDKEDEVVITKEDIFCEVTKQKALYSKFCEPYMLEVLYLITAKKRFIQCMHLLEKFKYGADRFVATLDIQLMWLTYMSYPAIYAEDLKEMEGELEKVVGIWEEVKGGDVRRSKKVWEEEFDEPYERAGATLDAKLKPPVHWVVSDADVNFKYNSLEPRFLLEVCVFMKGKLQLNPSQHKKHDYIRLRAIRCHKDFKTDECLAFVRFDAWEKICHVYCEFKTKGLIFELRQHGTSCWKSRVRGTVAFLWNDLLRAPCLTVGKDLGKIVSVVGSITPPVQAPYLLKCVPDRVTDDSGAMISDEILKMNRYRPQEGRWLSRTVLDHTGKECFIVRIRVGSGIWRRGGETPAVVKLEDRVIEIREGSWTYVGGSIGKASGKVAGTAKPDEISREKASWSLSTGDELIVHQVSSGFTFNLQNRTSTDSPMLIQGRKLQYQVTDEVIGKDEGKEQEESSFVTLVRYTPGNPNGRATALINWRLAVVEFLPEEDAVKVLLVCMAILRSVSEMVGEDMGNLLVRRRLREPRSGTRDWGSIVMHPSSLCASDLYRSPHVQPWHWNAKEVTAPIDDLNRRHMTVNYSPAEGEDKLYKRCIIPNSRGL